MAAIHSKDTKPEMIVRRGLESIAFTLNHIWLQDHQAHIIAYPQLEEEENLQMPMAAEDSDS